MTSDTPNDLPSLRARMQRLQALHAGGTLGEEAYRQGREAVEREIIARVTAGPTTGEAASSSAAETTAPSYRTRRGWRLGLGVLGLGLAVAGGYGWLQREQAAVPVAAHAGLSVPKAAAWAGADAVGGNAAGTTGTAAGTDPAPAASGAGHAVDRAQIAAMATKLAARLKDKPGDAEGWAMLARSYATLGRHADALPAYTKAVALRGDDAQLLADYADALAVTQGRLLDGEPLALVKRALKHDPDNLKALALAGTAAFAAQDYAGAVRHWEHLARVGPKGHPLVQHIQVSIDEARSLGKLAAPAFTAQR